MSTMPCQTSRTPIQSLLEAAHTEAPAFGHPYEGVLSERFGSLFPQPPLLSMPASHIVWDEIASALPIALESGRVRCLIDLLPAVACRRGKPRRVLSLPLRHCFRRARSCVRSGDQRRSEGLAPPPCPAPDFTGP